MEKSLHRHHVLEAVNAHLQVAFPRLAAESSALRFTPDFRDKNFRQLSLSASLLYVLKRLRKSFPFPEEGLRVAEVLLQHADSPALLSMLDRVYPNKVQRCFELLALKLLSFALMAGEPNTRTLGPLERDLEKQLGTLQTQAQTAKLPTTFVENKLLRPLLNDAGWRLLTSEGAQRVAEIFSSSRMPGLRAFADGMAQKLSPDAPMPETFLNLCAEPSPMPARDRKSFLLETFIRRHAENEKPVVQLKRRASLPVEPAARTRKAICKQLPRSLKFCYEPKKLVERRKPLPKSESLIDAAALKSLRELEGATQTCLSEEREQRQPKMPSCSELLLEDSDIRFSIMCESHADLF